MWLFFANVHNAANIRQENAILEVDYDFQYT